MNENINTSDATQEEQEIDLLELASKLWAKRRTIIKWTLIGAVCGLVIAFSIPKEYTASVKLAPETSNNKTGAAGGLGALASIAGISMGTGSSADAVYPELYPDVVLSIPFTVGLLNVKLDTKDGEETVQSILEDHTSAPWWSYIMKAPGAIIGGVKSIFSSDKDDEKDGVIDPYHLTPKQAALVESLNSCISANVDTKTSVVTISATLQDALAAAQLADTVMARLKEYVVDYRTSKSRQDLEYAKKINDEARAEYYGAQKQYASAVDRNQGLSKQSASIEIDRLENEKELAFNVYTTAAQQVKMAEAKVQETTPVFAVVQPATVPVRPSKPSKPMILIGFMFLFFVASSAYILFAPSLIEGFKAHRNVEGSEKV
ncbi:MAG: chain-length determining protein [Muribaculaceae bacterium]|nr:chain-length determining protein [Muribaculaceae bacterium]